MIAYLVHRVLRAQDFPRHIYLRQVSHIRRTPGAVSEFEVKWIRIEIIYNGWVERLGGLIRDEKHLLSITRKVIQNKESMHMTSPRQLKAMYEQGHNISALLREEKGVLRNTNEIIEISYDLQAGSYTTALEEDSVAERKSAYTAAIARSIRELCDPVSLLEAGVGEATTFSGVLTGLGASMPAFAFDLSWSRVAYARKWLQRAGDFNASLCTGSLLHLPYAEDSIDVVYTSHSIEPNGGFEEEILRELYRVACRYLILLEPGYELASDEARQRMDSHGYCKNLSGIAEALGYEVLKHELFTVTSNPLNPTAITVIKKGDCLPSPEYILACPQYKTPLLKIGGMMFSPEALVVYPIIGGIPCLRIENGVFASKYQDVMGEG